MAFWSPTATTAHAIHNFLESLNQHEDILRTPGQEKQEALLIQKTQLRLTALLVDEMRDIKQALNEYQELFGRPRIVFKNETIISEPHIDKRFRQPPDHG